MMNVRVGNNAAKSERTEYVSGNYFSTFGIGAYAGRMLQPSDDVPGAAPVAVLSYAAWQASHAGDPNVVGSTVHIQGQPVTIVGIAPPGFFGDRISSNPPALWIPLNMEPVMEGQTSILKQPDTNWLTLSAASSPESLPAACRPSSRIRLRQWLPTQSAYTDR